MSGNPSSSWIRLKLMRPDALRVDESKGSEKAANDVSGALSARLSTHRSGPIIRLEEEVKRRNEICLEPRSFPIPASLPPFTCIPRKPRKGKEGKCRRFPGNESSPLEAIRELG